MLVAHCSRLPFRPSPPAHELARSNRRQLLLAPACCQAQQGQPLRAVWAGGRAFDTVASLRHELKDLLRTSPKGALIEPHQQEWDLLLDVLKMHPRWEQKIGVGVRHFTTDYTDYLPRTRFFVVVRRDGSREDFSYLKCLQLAMSKLQDQPSARAALSPQGYLGMEIDYVLQRGVYAQAAAFKHQQLLRGGPRRCPVFPSLLLDDSNCRAQYRAPVSFRKLKAAWMESEGLTPADLELTAGNKLHPQQLVEKELLTSWQAFHKVHAQYCLMSHMAVDSLLRHRADEQ